MAKVSIVMTAYNAEKFIGESIESILNQTFSDFEFIIVNDGSSDLTPHIIRSYKDTRIKFFDHNVNRGSVPCLRWAIDLATSDLIATQDADDVSYVDRIEKQIRFMESNTQIFCVGGFAKKIDEKNNYLGEWTFPPITHEKIVSMMCTLKKSPIINPTSMFRKRDYIEIGGYSVNPSVVASYDLELWTKAILHKKQFANIPEFLVTYRCHANSMTQKLKKSQIAAYNRIMSNFLRRHKYESTKKMDRSRT